jgi:4-aminobutyrate aminotransferase-like enzyme
MGNADSLFYSEPLHIVRGEDVWLYDVEGNKYLDVYNNVAHVGHSNPYVVEAITRQAKTLNTNTRYLHENIVDLAEKITQLMPGELGVCYFVCSGSEANDLALQIARTYTKKQGCLVSENAYHGNTTAVFQMSPEDYAPEIRQDWAQTLPSPKNYQQTEQVELNYLKDLSLVVDNLDDLGIGTAAVIFDSIFSSDGIFLPPSGYLKTIYEAVRTSGGLAIADEVQSGFGRTGSYMWGFSHDGVVPDIVTLGKPMGNGYPIAAVVTTDEIAQTYNREYGYFNTFGGNPVACAAGLAVLEVIKKDQLMEHAKSTGLYFYQELIKLAERHDLISEVRGSGLFLGVELIDPIGKEPATKKTAEIVNLLSKNGVLVGKTGPDSNVIKMRPPMTFNKQHADIVVEKLEEILSSLF